MLVVYRKSDRKRLTGLNTNDLLPDGPDFGEFVQLNIIPIWGETLADYGEFRLHDVTDAATVKAVAEAADWDLQFDALGNPIGAATFPYLSASAAPSAAGVGQNVMVTATLPAGATDTQVGFSVNGGAEALVAVSALSASKAYAFAAAGTYYITVRSTTRYGQRTVQVVIQ